VLADGQEYAVNEVVVRLSMPQPAVSKHLGVLRRVGVVTMVKRGQHRMYRLNAAELKPVHDWVRTFERYWTHQLGQIKERAEAKARAGERTRGLNAGQHVARTRSGNGESR